MLILMLICLQLEVASGSDINLIIGREYQGEYIVKQPGVSIETFLENFRVLGSKDGANRSHLLWHT